MNLRPHFRIGSIIVCALIAGAVACGGASAPDLPGAPTSAVVINGAGASFPYPIYSKWAHQYNQLNNVAINYQSIGSGAGIAQIKARTVDFGATDAPLSGTDLDAEGLVQFPMLIGGVVPVVNIQGLSSGQLKLTPDLLAAIYLGSITKWNDARIAAVNADLALPDKEITVVRRSDGSGTTWLFTTWLSAVSADWKTRVGAGKAVEWPVGIGGRGNGGVANFVTRIDGAIGYIEYAHALQNQMNVVQLQNRDGVFVSPTFESFQAAAANADWQSTPGFGIVLVNQTGAGTWPITGATFILMHKDQADAAKARALLDFFDWCYTHGDQEARGLHYVPLPEIVVQTIRASWAEIQSAGRPVRPAAAPPTGT